MRRFEERLKVASLLHDRVVLESGGWVGTAGPGGASEMRLPDSARPFPVDTARRRHDAMGRNFFVRVKPSGSTGPFHNLVTSPAAVSFMATYRPIRDHLPASANWVEFTSFELVPKAKQHVDRLADQEARDGLLEAIFPDEYAQGLIIKSALTSMVLASALGMAVSVDRLHASVIAARAARGQASPVPGHRALLAVIPDVRRVTWEQVAAARELPGLPRLRAVLGDVESAARQAAAAGRDIDRALIVEFHREYSRAVREAEDGWGSVAISVATGTAVSLALAPLSGPAAAIAGTAVATIVESGRMLIGHQRRRNRWEVAADELAAIAGRSRAA